MLKGITSGLVFCVQEAKVKQQHKNKLKYVFKKMTLGIYSVQNHIVDGLATFYDGNFYNLVNTEVIVPGRATKVSLFAPSCNRNLHIYNIYSHANPNEKNAAYNLFVSLNLSLDNVPADDACVVCGDFNQDISFHNNIVTKEILKMIKKHILRY